MAKHQTIGRQVGEHIKNIRLKNGFGQGKVAAALDISVAALSKIENGLTDINISRLQQIAVFFKVSVLELISRDVKSATPAQVLADIEVLKQEISAKDAEISKLQKKLIDLYEKLNP